MHNFRKDQRAIVLFALYCIVSLKVSRYCCCTQVIEEEVKKCGASGEVCPVRCDLRRESDILDMFQLIRSKYARLDICINNAAQVLRKTLSDGTAAEWREMLDVSVFLYFSGNPA